MEKDGTAENRKDFRFALLFLDVPQFERATVGRQPILVEVSDKDQTVLKFRHRMLVKICVHGKFAAGRDRMKAAAVSPDL